MKVVLTFIIMTFTLASFLYLTGITYDNPSNTVGILVAIGSGDLSIFLDPLNGILLIALGIITGVSLINALTGGNASVAITTGLASLASWLFLNVIRDYISLLKKVGEGCVLASGGLCSIVYWVTWFFVVLTTLAFIWVVIEWVGGND
jgi:hypothetical protein